MEKWEKEFDRIFVDENVWQGEDDYTKNVPIGNIKKFIESLLEERDTYWKERVRKEVEAERERFAELVWMANDKFDSGDSWEHGIRQWLLLEVKNYEV